MPGKYPFFGAVQTLAGTAIVNSFVQSTTPIQPSNANRIRFYVVATLAGGSGVTTVTVKLQHRYNDPNTSPATTSGWIDLPSNLDDVQGAAQPKGSTFEISHAITVTAGQTTTGAFYLAKPYGLNDVVTAIEANTTGNSADTITIYAVAG